MRFTLHLGGMMNLNSLSREHLISFALWAIGIFLAGLSLEKRRQQELSFKKWTRNSKSLRTLKQNGVLSFYLLKIEESLQILGYQISWKHYLLYSLIVAVAVFTLTIFLTNIYLAFSLTVGIQFLSYAVLQYRAHLEERRQFKDLNLALSLLTNAYLENPDLLSVIKGSLTRMPERVDGIFTDFVIHVEMVDPDLEKGVMQLKQEVNNQYFQRYCDVLLQCLRDRDYIRVLPAIVSEMTEARNNMEEFEETLEDIFKENVQLLLVTAVTPIFINYIFPAFTPYLRDTFFGQFIVALSYLLLSITAGIVLLVRRPPSEN